MKRLAISVNGGGALGIGPAHILARLESDLGGRSICEVSHAYAGTSTGAIIAGCLAENINGNEIFKLYQDNVKKIFTKYSLLKRINPKCPPYDNSNLKALLKKKLRGRCSEWFKPIFIPSVYMNGESEEKVWDKGDKDTEKWFAVLSSTAAPTYFDVAIDDKGHRCFCDGGLWGNDPVMSLVAGLLSIGWERDSFKILSFNTTFDTPHTDFGNKTKLGWGSYILNGWVARSGKANYFEACAVIGKENIFRCSPKNDKSLEMDDTSDKNIERVIDIWENWYAENKKDLLYFLQH